MIWKAIRRRMRGWVIWFSRFRASESSRMIWRKASRSMRPVVASMTQEPKVFLRNKNQINMGLFIMSEGSVDRISLDQIFLPFFTRSNCYLKLSIWWKLTISCNLLILDPGGSRGPIHLIWPPQIHFWPHKAPTSQLFFTWKILPSVKSRNGVKKRKPPTLIWGNTHC
jgi:hypothetical protein